VNIGTRELKSRLGQRYVFVDEGDAIAVSRIERNGGFA
jgi:hypothetical protein